MLFRFLNLQMRHFGKFVWISLLLIVVGLYFSKDLRLDSNLKSLLPRDTPSVQNLEVIQAKSGSTNDLRVLLWGGSLEDRIKAADEFSHFLEKKENFARWIQFRTPKEFLEEHKFVFVRHETLDLILERLQTERKKNADVTDPLGLEKTLEDEQSEANASKTSTTLETDSSTPDQEDQQIEKAKELLTRLDSMRPYYQTEDGAYLAIRIFPHAERYDLQNNKRLVNRLEELVQEFNFKRFHPDMESMVYGSIYRAVEKFESIQADVSFGSWGILAIILIVAIFFRSFWAPAILIPPLVTGLSVGLGLVTLFEKKLNTVAIFLVMVVFGVGIEFGVHLWARMLQERRSKSVFDSLVATWASTGRATVTSAVALLMGFALLTVSSFEGFAQFGRVAIVLISTTAAGFLIFTPSWILLVEQIRKQKPWPTSLADLVFLKVHHQPGKAFYRTALAVRAFSIFLAPVILMLSVLFLRFDYSFEEKVKARRELPEAYQSGSLWTERTKPSAIAVFSSLEEVNQVESFYEKNSEAYPDIVLVSSLATFFPPDQEARIAKLQEISDEIDADLVKRWKDPEIREALLEIQEKAYDYQPFSLDAVPTELKQAFVPVDGSEGTLLQLYDKGGRADGRKAMKFSDAVVKFFEDQQMAPLYSGDEIIFGDIVRRVIQEGPWLILGMFILVFFICYLDFRTWRAAFTTLLPILYGFVMTGAVIVLSGVKLNFYNMAALASLGAMVVDNSIHLFHRFLDYRDQNNGELKFEAGRMATYSVVPTVITCTLTSICGYGGMLFANHSGIASLGFVAVTGLLCCLVSTVIFFPTWLMWLKGKF